MIYHDVFAVPGLTVEKMGRGKETRWWLVMENGTSTRGFADSRELLETYQGGFTAAGIEALKEWLKRS